MAHLQDVHRKGGADSSSTASYANTFRTAGHAGQSDSERGCSSMFMKVIKVKNVTAEPTPNFDSEISFSGR